MIFTVAKKFGYSKYHSVTEMLLQLRLPSFDTVIHNNRCSFFAMWNNHDNGVVKLMRCVRPSVYIWLYYLVFFSHRFHVYLVVFFFAFLLFIVFYPCLWTAGLIQIKWWWWWLKVTFNVELIAINFRYTVVINSEFHRFVT